MTLKMTKSDIDFTNRYIRVSKTYDPANRVVGAPKTAPTLLSWHNREFPWMSLPHFCRIFEF